VIQRCGHRVASAQWIQAAEALSEVVGRMGDHGWTVMRRGGHQARLVNAAGTTAVAAVYPLGVQTQTIRALARQLAATADCPDMLFVYTGEASAVGRVQWRKTGKPLVVIGALGGSRDARLGGR
jgi:nucleotide-binding universal stress UspA family protein